MADCTSDSIINSTILNYKKGNVGDQYEVKEHVRGKNPQAGPALKVCLGDVTSP